MRNKANAKVKPKMSRDDLNALFGVVPGAPGNGKAKVTNPCQRGFVHKVNPAKIAPKGQERPQDYHKRMRKARIAKGWKS